MVGEIEGILDALNQAHVRYLVVGGVAVVLHGYLRTTADLDLIIQLDRDNVLRAIRTLQDHHYCPRAPVAVEDFANRYGSNGFEKKDWGWRLICSCLNPLISTSCTPVRYASPWKRQKPRSSPSKT